jgi:non-specific serine/threonine protein kinase
VLLVLDNCEHLVEACAALVDALLRSCPRLRVLATSREALGMDGESAWFVPSLNLPDHGQQPSIEEMRRSEAISLFVDRANAVVSTFELTEGNAPAVARVCHMLDGMPLAIELAAARVRVLCVDQISSRLEDSFTLLTGGSHTALPRQRTLRATIDWSYELLCEEERVLLGRLSVFAGGWTLSAATEVCSGEGIESDEVLDLLANLVDKSLVMVAEQDGEARYRLLETVRQYGREKLEESGEELSIRRHHAEFSLELAERVEPLINGKDRGFWLERLDAEHDNFRAALAWSRNEAEGETTLRLSGALSWLWYHREYWSEWRRWLGGALAIREGAGGWRWTAARAKALSGGGFLAWMQGDQDTARAQLEESVALWREVGDKQGLAQALRFLSGSFESRGDCAAARPLALRYLGIGAFRESDHKEAVARLAESLTVLQETGNPLYMQNLELLAAAVSMQGDYRRAALLFGAAQALREAVGAFVLPLYRAEYDRGVAAARTGLDDTTFQASWSEGRTMTPEDAVEHALGKQEAATASPEDTSLLSAREVEVLGLVAEGMTDPQVAQKLYLSPRTVGQHLRSIYRKLGVPSRAAAAREALQRGLI